MVRRSILLGLLPVASAAPALVAEPTVYAAAVIRAPEPTAAPELAERGITDDVATYVSGVISHVEGRVSSLLDSGILDFPNGFPTGTAVKKSLGLDDDDDLDAQPTQVLNVP